MSSTSVTVTSYSMHKGMSTLDRRVQFNSMVDALYDLCSDVFFLQGVQDRHQARSGKIDGFPEQSHYDFLGERLSYNRSYGRNVVYPQRHHDSTILSCLPAGTLYNLNITVNRLEQRGALHYGVPPGGWKTSLVCLYIHLNLREPDRAEQYHAIFEYVSMRIDPASPLIIASDFNGWREKSTLSLGKALSLDEVFVNGNGHRPKTFPSRILFLSFDRVYTRSLGALDAQIHDNKHWQHLSDHLSLSVKVRPKLKLPRQAA